MSYAAGEARILTLIRASGGGTIWTAANSLSIVNDSNNIGMSMVNNGKSWHYLFLEPGPFASDYLDIGAEGVQDTWTTLITILVLKETQRGPIKVLSDDTQQIKDYLDTYSRLNALTGVSMAKVKSGTRITTERVGGANPQARANRKVFFKRELTIAWDELTDITQNDQG